MNVEQRQRIERQCVRKLLSLIVDRGLFYSLDNGEEESDRFCDVKPGMDFITATDAEHLYIYSDKENETVLAWIFLIYGNDGWDVVVNYSTNATTDNLFESEDGYWKWLDKTFENVM